MTSLDTNRDAVRATDLAICEWDPVYMRPARLTDRFHSLAQGNYRRINGETYHLCRACNVIIGRHLGEVNGKGRR